MFTWQVASTGLNGLGFATFYSISGTQPYGFGSPPEEINFSIFDMHGLLDQLVPSNAAISDGPGPNGGIIAKSSRFIFEEKQVFLELSSQTLMSFGPSFCKIGKTFLNSMSQKKEE